VEALEAIGQVLWALLLTCGVLALAYWFTRRVAGRLAVGGKLAGSRMEVLDQMPLGRDQRLVVARVGRTVCLLGVSSGGITCLRVLTEEEAEEWLAPGPDQTPGTGGTPPRFREALRRVLDQRRP
jgi:flagellar protein FliO/FliZ